MLGYKLNFVNATHDNKEYFQMILGKFIQGNDLNQTKQAKLSLFLTASV